MKGTLNGGCKGQIVSLFAVLSLMACGGGGGDGQASIPTPAPAGIENVFVAPTASGNGSGRDWSNAAQWSTLAPSRGRTYYLADGSYGGKTLSTEEIGSAVIEIRKCTTTDGVSSTAAGYSPSICDGVATFSGRITLTTDYWTINGVTRNSADWADGDSYGFRASEIYTTSPDRLSKCASHVTVKYLNLGGAEGTSYTGGEPDSAIYQGGFYDTCTNWTIEHNYIHNVLVSIMFGGSNGAVVQYNRFQWSWGKECIRGQNVAKNLIIRFNQFYNACGYTGLPGEGCTAEIAIWDADAGNLDNNEIYGNWFYLNRDANSGGSIVIGGNSTSWAGSAANNTLVYNNTFAGYSAGWMAGNILVNGGSGNICRNNLWYDTPIASASCNTTSNNVLASSNPFVRYPSNPDLHLSAGATASYALGNPYNVDMDGKIRGADGTWDVGAYEF